LNSNLWANLDVFPPPATTAMSTGARPQILRVVTRTTAWLVTLRDSRGSMDVWTWSLRRWW
jgi:hypothetical protein